MFAILTEAQTQVVLVLLGLVLLLLVGGVYNTLRRISELEKVVFKSSTKTAELQDAIEAVHEDSATQRSE